LIKLKKNVLFILFFYLQAIAIAQTPTPEGVTSVKSAKDFYNMGDFRIAFAEYKKLLEIDPNNVNYQYLAGECILRGTFIAKSNAIPYLKTASELEKPPIDVLYLLGQAYLLNYQFDDALKTTKKFLETNQNEQLKKLAERQIEMIEHAKKMVKSPLNVSIENLGPNVNSPEPDYYAFVHENEDFLIFSTRREKGNSGYLMEDGYKSGDIFIVNEKRGEWTKARAFGGGLTSIYDEEVVGMSPDGEVIFINLDTYEITGQIMVSYKSGKQYGKPELLLGGINTDFMEATACISSDKNTIYFSSDRVGGYGGFDIYKSVKLPNGEWGEAINLGPEINTEYDEYFPNISYDGMTLYFSSEGHESMGGFDIFSAQFDYSKNSWSKPKNIGYPINSTDDDFHISFTKDKKRGYITALREDGIGDLDIYCVTFHDIEENQTAVIGNLTADVDIDYNNYQTFHYYEVDGVTKRIPAEINKDRVNWNYTKTEKTIVKPGMQYKYSFIMEKDNEEQRFSYDKAPLDDLSYAIKDVKIVMVPIEGYKTPPKNLPKQTSVPIQNAYLEVFDSNQKLVGKYLANPHTGKYIVILPPGKYDMTIEADGFKKTETKLNILDKGSFKNEITKDYKLEPLAPLAPIHFSNLKSSAVK
jgi:hypothetical protein